METLTLVLLVAILIFLIGNILLFFLEKKQKSKDAKKLPLGSASQQVLNSKVDVLNKRISRLENKEKKKPRTIKAIIKKGKAKSNYPITKYKRKKKV